MNITELIIKLCIVALFLSWNAWPCMAKLHSLPIDQFLIMGVVELISHSFLFFFFVKVNRKLSQCLSDQSVLYKIAKVMQCINKLTFIQKPYMKCCNFTDLSLFHLPCELLFIHEGPGHYLCYHHMERRKKQDSVVAKKNKLTLSDKQLLIPALT